MMNAQTQLDNLERYVVLLWRSLCVRALIFVFGRLRRDAAEPDVLVLALGAFCWAGILIRLASLVIPLGDLAADPARRRASSGTVPPQDARTRRESSTAAKGGGPRFAPGELIASEARVCFTNGLGSAFVVRGKQYTKDKLKVPSAQPLYELIATDAFTSESRLESVASAVRLEALLDGLDPAVRAGAAPRLPPLIVLQCQLPDAAPAMNGSGDGPTTHFVFYLALTAAARRALDSLDAPAGADGASERAVLDALRLFIEWVERAPNEPSFFMRLKGVGMISKASLAALQVPSFIKLYNGKPCLIRPNQGSAELRGEVLEIVVNGNQFGYFGRQAMWRMRPLVNEISWHIGFTIEGRASDELPEHLFCAIEVNKYQLEWSPSLEEELAAAAGRETTLSGVPPPNSTPGGLARRPLARPSTPKRTDHKTICVEVMSVHEVHTVEIHTSQTARELLARVVAMSTPANAPTDVERLLAEATMKQGGEGRPMDGENQIAEAVSEAELADTSAALDRDAKASAIADAPPSTRTTISIDEASQGDDPGVREVLAARTATAAGAVGEAKPIDAVAAAEPSRPPTDVAAVAAVSNGDQAAPKVPGALEPPRAAGEQTLFDLVRNQEMQLDMSVGAQGIHDGHLLMVRSGEFEGSGRQPTQQSRFSTRMSRFSGWRRGGTRKRDAPPPMVPPHAEAKSSSASEQRVGAFWKRVLTSRKDSATTGPAHRRVSDESRRSAAEWPERALTANDRRGGETEGPLSDTESERVSSAERAALGS